MPSKSDRRFLLALLLAIALNLPSRLSKPQETLGFKYGSAGMRESRTYWDLRLTLGIPFSRWGAEPFITQPIPFPATGWQQLEVSHASVKQNPVPHPFELARRWREEIETDSGLTKAGIAKREGFSRARVTQIMNLLHLPELIQRTLETPPEPLHIGVFSERRLRELLAEDDPAAQMDFWRKWLRELRGLT